MIKEIIYDHTIFNNGSFKHYLSVVEIINVLEKITETNEMIENLLLIPFYKNDILKINLKFNDMILYIKCEKNITEEKKKIFLRRYCKENYKIDNDIKKRYYLCDYEDIVSFQKSIKDYSNYLLETLILKMNKIVLEDSKVDINNILCGYICFDILTN